MSGVSGKIPAARFANTPGVDLANLRGTDPNFPKGCATCCCAPCTIGKYEQDNGSPNAIFAWVFCFLFCPVACLYACMIWRPKVNPDIKGDTVVGAPIAAQPQVMQIHVTSQQQPGPYGTIQSHQQPMYVQGQTVHQETITQQVTPVPQEQPAAHPVNM